MGACCSNPYAGVDVYAAQERHVTAFIDAHCERGSDYSCMMTEFIAAFCGSSHAELLVNEVGYLNPVVITQTLRRLDFKMKGWLTYETFNQPYIYVEGLRIAPVRTELKI